MPRADSGWKYWTLLALPLVIGVIPVIAVMILSFIRWGWIAPVIQGGVLSVMGIFALGLSHRTGGKS